MSTKTLNCPVSGPIAIEVQSTSVDVTVEVDPRASVARVELSGPDDFINDVRTETGAGPVWRVELPRTAGNGTHVISAGDLHIGNISFGRGASQVNSFGRGGRTIVDGVDVTDYVQSQRGQGGAAFEPARMRAILPPGSSVIAFTASGDVEVTGRIARASIRVASGDVEIDGVGDANIQSASGDIRIGELTGPAGLNSASGDISVEDVRAALSVTTAFGDIRAHVTETVRVDARSTSGDVRITAASGVAPLVRADSRTGRVRLPR